MGANGPEWGFPPLSDYVYRIRDKRYRVGLAGKQTLKLLTEIYFANRHTSGPYWLIPFRKQIREIQRINSRGVLSLTVERTPDPKLRLLAIWLRGRCGGTLGTSILADYVTHLDPQTRKEVARALKRMSAWVQLRQLADTDPSERIRRMATPEPARPYRDRLADFSNRFRRFQVSSARQPLFVSPEVDFGEGRPPKSIAIIRALLERIHRLVSGTLN